MNLQPSGLRRFLSSLTIVLALTSMSLMLPLVVEAASFADVVIVVDELGSMSGEHARIGGMIPTLDANLISRGVGAGADANRYGLVGFGASSAHGVSGHSHAVGGGELGTAAQFVTATSGLVISGSTEDGYSGIATALGYNFRPGAAVNIILITDEDRDVLPDSSHTFGNVLVGLSSKSALLNVVVDHGFANGTGTAAVGVDSVGNAYVANGAGGFTSSAGGVATTGFGTTKADYINLAWANGGAAWDLNKFRAEGLTADSFTAACVNIKTEEIIRQPPTGAVPESASLLLLGSGLAVLAVWECARACRGLHCIEVLSVSRNASSSSFQLRELLNESDRLVRAVQDNGRKGEQPDSDEPVGRESPATLVPAALFRHGTIWYV